MDVRNSGLGSELSTLGVREAEGGMVVRFNSLLRSFALAGDGTARCFALPSSCVGLEVEDWQSSSDLPLSGAGVINSGRVV